MAAPADRFVDSVGVNVHLSAPPYHDAFPLVARCLAACGVRHVRDELRPGNDLAHWRQLHRQGVRGHLLVSPATNTATEMLDYLQALGAEKVSAIEGQNEGDSPWFMAHPAARGNWAATVIAYQIEVHRALRGRYAPAALPLVSPTVLDYRPGDMRLLRPTAPLCDAVAVHAYPQGQQEPETQDDYAGLGWYRRAFADEFKPEAPVMATEAGYCTGSAGISAAAQAKYVPRLLLHAFAQGFRRTFLYELMDEGTDPADPEQNYGLVAVDGTPKPAFHAMGMLLTALADPGPPIEERPALVGLVRGPADLRMVPFAKRDGRQVVALWRAARSWNPASRRDIAVPAAPVSLRLPAAVRDAAALMLAPAQEWQQHDAAGMLDLWVGDTVTLLRLRGDI